MMKEMDELNALNERLKSVNLAWSTIKSDLIELVGNWKRAELGFQNTTNEYHADLRPEITASDDVITLTLRFGQAIIRKNDPIGHLSLLFTRETSFGSDSLLVLYKVELSDDNVREMVRVDDQTFSSCSVQDVLETVRLNLLHPKILPLRVRSAIVTMNASTGS